MLFKSIVFVLLTLGSVCGSFEPGRLPPAYLALGSSGVASERARFFSNNPALVALVEQNELSLQYRNFYNIAQLNEFGLSFLGQVKHWPFGLFVRQFGDQNYREQQLAVVLGRTFFKTLALGVAIQSYFLQIKNYGNYQAFGLTLGMQLRLFKWLNLASVVGNINQPKLGPYRGDIPVWFVNGLYLKLLPALHVTFDLFKDERFDFDYRTGVRVKLSRPFTLLFGFRQQVHSFSAGFIFKRKVVSVCYALEYHLNLGVSNAISVGYYF